MPLGLAKDSMLNLAEMAERKENEEGDSSSSQIPYEETGDNRETFMRVSLREKKSRSDDAARATATATATAEANPEDDGGEEDGIGNQGVTNLVDSLSMLELEGIAAAPPPPRVEASPQAPGTLTTSHNNLETSDQAAAPEEDSATATSAASSVTGDSETGSAAARRITTASPTTTSANNSDNNHDQYSGFSTDYREYAQYGDPSIYTSYETSPSLLLGQKGANGQGLWCCLFPWMAAPLPSHDNMEDTPGSDSMVKLDGTGGVGSLSRMSSNDDDEVSTGSDVFGERLSDKDRQAVLARLRLAQPDATIAAPNSPEAEDKPKEKGLLNAIVLPFDPDKPKGILKRPSTMSKQRLDMMNQSLSNGSGDGSQQRRRSLFPQYEPPKKEKKNLKAEFSPMARVLTVKSQKEMEDEEKAAIWWQRSDYDEFRKTGRMITRAMLAGGSEIWLATNQSWLAPNKDRKATLKNAYSLADRHAAFKKGDINAKREYEETRDKWWHKFGHSRRGLEHIASIDEGRQRQGNVRFAIKAIIDEQRRQKVFHREDPDKLRMVSIQHTSWARDLAMAAGASDADAVSKNFDENNRKSREFYLLKFSRADQQSAQKSKRASVPAFMKPAVSMGVNKANHLDANTMSQIRYRQTKKKIASVAPAPSQKSQTTNAAQSISVRDIPADGVAVKKSMAKQAAGFIKGEEIGNMSAVLTGMGAFPKTAGTVGGP